MTISPPRSRVCLPILAALASACGGARPPAEPAQASSESEPEAPAPSASSAAPASEPPHALPTACTRKAELCTFSNEFVDRLCSRQYLDATLALFANPQWTRAYLRGAVDAWNASGGASLRAKLAFDEEVIVLRRRVPQGSIIVGDNGGYDVLRWDGYCYSLDAEQVTLKPPPHPRRALVPFFRIGKSMQDALLASPAVTKAYAKRMKECGGATQGDVSLACEKANAALSTTATDFVLSGAKLPTPDKLP